MRFSLFLLISSFLFLVSCGGPNRAPVTTYGVQNGAGSVGVHTVSGGDTLYSIAGRYNVRMEDLKILNDLRPPYALEIGQRLKMPAPKTYRMRYGDTLYFLSYMFDVDVEETARLNGIDDPLRVEVGRVLKLPPLRKSAPVVTTTKQESVPVPEGKPQQQEEDKKKPVQVSRQQSKIHVDTPKRSSSKFLKPVDGKVISSYGPKADGLHNDGINILASRGTPVRSAENGVVVYAGNGLKGSGNLVLVRHEDRWMTAYGHLEDIAIKSGDVVKRGQSIGRVGSSGAVNRPQLHFEVRRGTEAINPVPYF